MSKPLVAKWLTLRPWKYKHLPLAGALFVNVLVANVCKRCMMSCYCMYWHSNHMAQINIACLFLWVCLLCLLFILLGFLILLLLLYHFVADWLTCSFDKGCVQFCVAEDLMQQTGWQCLVLTRMAITIAQRGPLHDTTDNWVAPISSVSCVGYRLPLFLLFTYMCCARSPSWAVVTRPAGIFC